MPFDNRRPYLKAPVRSSSMRSVYLRRILSALAAAQDIASFEKRITVKKLGQWPDGRDLRAA